MTVTIDDLELARRRLHGIVEPTPLILSETLSRMLEAEVFIKPENLQKTGSFKIRGAYNRIAALTPEEKARGVIAASAGNHGQALAYAATRAGVKATIVMPETAAIAKVAATRNYGQAVILEGIDYQAARVAAGRIRGESGAVFVDAYDDAQVVAGQGSVGLEIAEELEGARRADAVLVPVGGGGLIAGIAVALAARSPATEVIGVEAAGSAQLSASLAANRAASIGKAVDTIADGLATGRIGEIPYSLIRGRVARAVTVDDFEIGAAVLLMLERMKLLAEGAGAAALAGALKLGAELKGKRVVVVVSGGNIDINLLDRIIGHGLSKMGRLYRIGLTLHDRPGELGILLDQIGKTGANVRAIDHDRTRREVAIGGAYVSLELETRGPEHIAAIHAHLRKAGYEITDEN
ncbi:MAG TPA: threonine ammonia-lyase [Candidatus Binataceae bacterium]|nr:threonine ammonia-lyase [Candidatus Binataceae bacterium]